MIKNLTKQTAKVYITGFGPGDPDLLTIKAVNKLKTKNNSI